MDQAQFDQYAEQGFNRIPVTRTESADLETPVSTWAKLGGASGSYLFESVHSGDRWGRFSIIGLPANTFIRAHGEQISVITDGEVVEQVQGNPLDFIADFMTRFKAPEEHRHSRISGGLAGYFGYESIGYMEPRLAGKHPPDTLGLPDIMLSLNEEMVLFDNLSGDLTIIVYADPQQPDAYASAQQRLDEISNALDKDLPDSVSRLHEIPESLQIHEEAFTTASGKERFVDAVNTAKDYIHAGDIMQVVLSDRWSLPFHESPLAFYRALRRLNPSPYMYLMNFDDHSVVGSSPETLVRLEDGVVTVRPIAGTRRRGHNPEDDLAMEQDMVKDPKEVAEHLMLLDLGRNDVGRISQTGSVKVTEKMIVERLSHVMHLTSNVVGQIKPELSALDVLRAAFPAGTLSGAPKVRAMEIIAELEPIKRGIYGGAIGHLGWGGNNMDLAIAIRTGVLHDKMLYAQAGAGIVADSQPDLEWKECMNKARALFRAAAMVQAPGQ